MKRKPLLNGSPQKSFDADVKAHQEARRKIMEGVAIVCERHGDDAAFYYEALALTPADQIVLCSCSFGKAERQPMSAYESVVWMAHQKWAEKFDADNSVHDAATSRWLMIVARAMERGAASVSLRKSKGVFTVTLTPKLSKQWETASERAGIPLDWMIHDTLKGDVEHYLEDATGYMADTRPVWYEQRKAKVPIQVVKA